VQQALPVPLALAGRGSAHAAGAGGVAHVVVRGTEPAARPVSTHKPHSVGVFGSGHGAKRREASLAEVLAAAHHPAIDGDFEEDREAGLAVGL
jgi:hypothetical protein